MLQLHNVARLRAFWSFFNVELNLLAFLQGLVPFALDRGEMYEHIVLFRNGNEPKTLLRVKPLYYSSFHETDLHKNL